MSVDGRTASLYPVALISPCVHHQSPGWGGGQLNCAGNLMISKNFKAEFDDFSRPLS